MLLRLIRRGVFVQAAARLADLSLESGQTEASQPRRSGSGSTFSARPIIPIHFPEHENCQEKRNQSEEAKEGLCRVFRAKPFFDQHSQAQLKRYGEQDTTRSGNSKLPERHVQHARHRDRRGAAARYESGENDHPGSAMVQLVLGL